MQDTEQVVWYTQNIGSKVSNNWIKFTTYLNTHLHLILIWMSKLAHREGEYQFVDPMPKVMQQVNLFDLLLDNFVGNLFLMDQGVDPFPP